MKIKKITVKNFKALSEEEVNFEGCSAIIIGGNNSGKTTLLTGLIDRLRGEKPEIILKEGEKNGNSLIELTDGSKIEWRFTEKSESFSFTTKEGIKMTQGVIREIGSLYFGLKFDIDKFLNSSPRDQLNSMQKLIGLDFTDIDMRYNQAYKERSEANLEVKRLLNLNLSEPEKVIKPDIDKLNKEFSLLESQNIKLREDWKKKTKLKEEEIRDFNEEQEKLSQNIIMNKNAINKIEQIMIENEYLSKFWDNENAKKFINNLPQPEEKKVFKIPIEPAYNDFSEKRKEIEQAHVEMRNYDSYTSKFKTYNSWVKDGKEAREKANKCQDKINKILSEKKEMLKSAKMPEEFTFGEDGIYYNGFPFSKNQMSSSSKYIAALKLGSIALGEVKTMHFDASFLDKNSLSDIQEWSNNNNLQLLIERPDFDGGEIKYEII